MIITQWEEIQGLPRGSWGGCTMTLNVCWYETLKMGV